MCEDLGKCSRKYKQDHKLRTSQLTIPPPLRSPTHILRHPHHSGSHMYTWTHFQPLLTGTNMRVASVKKRSAGRMDGSKHLHPSNLQATLVWRWHSFTLSIRTVLKAGAEPKTRSTLLHTFLKCECLFSFSQYHYSNINKFWKKKINKYVLLNNKVNH